MLANTQRSPKPLLSIGALLLALLACAPLSVLAEPTPTPLPAPTVAAATSEVEEAAPTSQPTEPAEVDTSDAPEGWARFSDESTGLSFIYPANWNGPEVNRWQTGIGVEVGTDTVYPFGTGLDQREYSVTDAYFISIQYNVTSAGGDWQQFVDNQPWVQGYVELLELEDGESITTPRSLTIRLREVEAGEFSGLEYIATLSETAQTQIVYTREALLFDEELNHIRVSGNPNNVQILEGEDWRAAYERVDREHEDIFHQVLQSIQISTNE